MALTLVTGTPGWLGSRLVEVLAGRARDYAAPPPPVAPGPVRCLVQPGVDPGPLAALGGAVELVSGDLRDPAAVAALCRDARGATLFHAAAVIHPRRTSREFEAVNVGGSRNLLDAAARAGVRRVVAVSSTSPTGVSRRPEPFDESSPYRPYLGYGRSKMRMELLLRDRHRSGAFEAVVVRAPWFYGPGQPPRQALFFRLIRTGRVPLLGDGSSLRSMAYVDNLCQGLLLAATHPAASGETYWIADRRPYPMAEIVATVERLLERELGLAVAHRRLRLPAPAGDLARLADRLLQALGLYQQKLHVLGEMNVHIAVSVAKAERELGYDPKVELEEGMRRSLADCRERGLGL